MNFTDVLEGTARWSIEKADWIQWAHSLPDDSIDMVICSPPYEAQRTYGVGFKLRGEDWVRWMLEGITALAPKVRGLIAINCEGRTEDFRYSCVPILLQADLHRAGFNLRHPITFHRIGIPGSGGPDWLRNDCETIICVTRPGALPFSDNTACGHPPKWAPGGEMSHRLSGGERRNQWGSNSSSTEVRTNGERKERGEHPSHVVESKAAASKKHTKAIVRYGEDIDVEQTYTPPAIANPGNVVQQLYTADEVEAILPDAGDLIHLKVGGGLMGSKKAHENEAPFPMELPKFFIKSFCPPGGVVADPFSGSGTTCHVAVQHGMRFIGCDLRQSQVDLCIKRMKEEGEGLFDGQA